MGAWNLALFIVRIPTSRDTEFRYSHRRGVDVPTKCTPVWSAKARRSRPLSLSNIGRYFAHVGCRGKLFRESLQTKDRQTAGRKLRDFRRRIERVDHCAGRVSLSELCERYEPTLAHLADSTRMAKAGILARLRSGWPGGAEQLVAEIKAQARRGPESALVTRAPRRDFSSRVQVTRAAALVVRRIQSLRVRRAML